MIRSNFTVCYVLLYSQLIVLYSQLIFDHINWENPLVDSIGKSLSNRHYMCGLTPCKDWKNFYNFCIELHIYQVNFLVDEAVALLPNQL